MVSKACVSEKGGLILALCLLPLPAVLFAERLVLQPRTQKPFLVPRKHYSQSFPLMGLE